MSIDDINYIVTSFAAFATDSIFTPFAAGLVVVAALAMIRKVIRGYCR